MASPDKWLGRHRDIPICPAESFPSGAAGSAADYEHAMFALANLGQGASSGTVGDLPVNSMNVRAVMLTCDTALVGTATHWYTWNIWQKRNGFILVNTASATTVVAGTQAVTPTVMTNIYIGSQLQFSGGTGATETVTVSAVTPTTFTATFANGHSGGYAIASIPLVTATYTTTASATTVVAGVNVVTPTSMASIYVGSPLNFSGGTGATETVIVTAVTATTFTAAFVNGHSGGYVIAISEIALASHQFNVLINNANALLPGDVITVARVSNDATGLASPAFDITLDLVPAGIGR